jgi:hypothetical protein
MVDMERVITLDELVESVPEEMIREAESQRREHKRKTIAESKRDPKELNSMSKDLSKAQRIRNYLSANPEARNKDVVEALEAYSVTAADVANVKSISKRNSEPNDRVSKDAGKPRSESTAITSPGSSITLPELEAGVAFVKAAGSIMRAKHLLIIIEQIKAC